MLCRTLLFLSVLITQALTAPSFAFADEIPDIGPTGPVTKVATGFKFVEGPTFDNDGNLYFTDIRNDRINKMTPDGTVSVFVEPAEECNGLMIIGDQVYACSMKAGKLKSFRLSDGKETILADGYEGKRFNALNDLVVDQAGGVYFTDPFFGAPQPLPQGVQALYYRDAAGKVSRLADFEQVPNGVILSPDEKTLYVVPSFDKQMWAYPVKSPGKLGDGRVFCELAQAKDRTSMAGGDGLTVDTNGNLYITCSLGVQVFDPSGQQLGVISFPEIPANTTFGGKDRRTLYVTARTSVYAVPMKATGHVFPGPAK